MRFDININGLTGSPEELAGYSAKMLEYQLAVRLIKKMISSHNTSFESLTSQLDQCIALMEREGKDLLHLGNGLGEIVTLYAETENKIVGRCKAIHTNITELKKTDDNQKKYEEYKNKIDELYKILTFQNGDKQEALSLWLNLIQKMHIEDPSKCELSKEEKVAILNAIKPIAGMIDNKYDEIAAKNPFLNNFIKEHIDDFNSSDMNEKEKAVIALLSTNEWLPKIFGFKYRDRADSYYTVEDSLQNQWGFCDYMDELGSTLGMDLDTEITTFRYDGQEFRIQLWKGTYGWDSAVGGEFGIYSRPEWEAAGDPYKPGSKSSEMILYDAVDEVYQLPVKQTTSYKDSHRITKAFINNTAQYGDGTHYWNLNIRTEAGIHKNAIVSTYEINCRGKNEEFQQALYNSLLENKNLQVRQKGDIITVIYP